MIGRNGWRTAMALPRMALIAALAFGSTVAAQANPEAGNAGAGDTAREIREIAKEVAEKLEAVDRMLLESSRTQGVRTGSTDRLARSLEGNRTAGEGIDRLIDKLHELKEQCGN